MSTLVICSGGLDSVTLAHHVAAHGRLGALLSFHYGQRHCKELVFAKACAQRLHVPHHVIELSAVTPYLRGSALTDAANVAVPDGHYAAETMKDTVVPNRNAIMLTIAFGVAAGQGWDAVALAVHGGDHFIYPDCRPDFIDAFRIMQDKALDGLWSVGLEAPYLSLDKAGIVKQGAELGVPFAETWSCYKGNDIHCGRCGTCVERAEAFHLAGVCDPTAYADKRFWKKAVAERQATQGAA
ncbi:MAG: 7-cyano-7-deazaguanine synthase QueC [Alphaproteobacteria bacterium RIFOXYD12_FULL_60_8]|nr:MAG: 7-cyano-7-deazaguanine synthase QueC [Alphaproteobacteria bacterium RIFOXYD12_FULL_60_8]